MRAFLCFYLSAGPRPTSSIAQREKVLPIEVELNQQTYQLLMHQATTRKVFTARIFSLDLTCGEIQLTVGGFK